MWCNGRAELEIRQLIQNITGKDDLTVHTNRKVKLTDRFGWGLTARWRGKMISECSGAYSIMTFIIRMEVQEVTVALAWLSIH